MTQRGAVRRVSRSERLTHLRTHLPTHLPSVLILGGGELGSAVAHRLTKAGMQVFIVDLAQPTCIRRAVCFATALTEGSAVVEGVVAARAASVAGARSLARSGRIPVMVAAEGSIPVAKRSIPVAGMARALGARVVVDARMLKRAGVMSRRSAPLVVGLGPGLRAGRDAHVVVETNRGHDLGRLILKGTAEADTGRPAKIAGRGSERVIRAPGVGVFKGEARIGDVVRKGEAVGTIGGASSVPVRASIPGLLRGLIADGTEVKRGQKIGDIDPRGLAVDPFTISDKGRAVAGGVLEAIINWWVDQDGRR